MCGTLKLGFSTLRLVYELLFCYQTDFMLRYSDRIAVYAA
jgi:hypothetical protein